MTGPPPDAGRDEAFWRDFLSNGDANERRTRRLFKLLPHGPRCKLCAAPFAGAGAPVMRLLGKRPSGQNPSVCATCFDFLATHHGGAEIDCSILFADIRGSTSMAERMSAADFRRLLDRFYAAASRVVFDHDGVLDKFVGDEVMATFYPLISGPDHAAGAVRAAEAVLRATGHAEPGGPWLPVGAGVGTGTAWVGAVGEGGHIEVTAVGDLVNTTARLAAAAEAGEVLVSVEAATAAGLDPGFGRRVLALKGKQLATEVVSDRIRPAEAGAVDGQLGGG